MLSDIICLNKECLNLLMIYCQMHPDNITPTSDQSEMQKCGKFIKIEESSNEQ